jgi:hypothetical protein
LYQTDALARRPASLLSVRFDATGLDHAIYVSGVNDVTIKGCVAKHRAFGGDCGCSNPTNGSTGTIVSTPFLSHSLSPEK